MGMDLCLLPFDSDFFSHTILDCERRWELWKPITAIESRIGRDVPDNFQSYKARDEEAGKSCYGKTLRTPYGDNLKYVLVSDLTALSGHASVQDNPKNRAIWAYLEKLAPDTKVALFWY